MNQVDKGLSLFSLGITTLLLTACGGDTAINGETITSVDNVDTVASIQAPVFKWKRVAASKIYQPSGDIKDISPTFKWKAIEGVTSYQLGHEDVDTELNWKYYTLTPAQAGCDDSTTCSYTPTDNLFSVGDYKAWWFRGKTDYNWGDWSNTYVFKVIGDPDEPSDGSEAISPAGEISTNTPTFKWTPTYGATDYQIGYEKTDSTGWHSISLNANGLNCEEGQCEYTIGNSIQSGVNMTWWVRPKVYGSYADFGKGRAFKISKNNNFRELIPEDSNTALGGETDIIYIADIRKEDGGQNRVIRIDALNMKATALDITKGSNPHSIDRAGDSNKFYVRTQSSNSISVINFNTETEKVIDLGDLFPRTAGATNLKYNLQLVSSHNKPVITIIDTIKDEVVGRVGDENATAPNMANGHPLWLDNDHFALIDRVNNVVSVYKVEDIEGLMSFVWKDELSFRSSSHIAHTMVKLNPSRFFMMGEGNLDKGLSPFVAKIDFNAEYGTLQQVSSTLLTQSNKKVHGVSPVLHHGGLSPDGKYFYTTNLDGKTYILDRVTMEIETIVETGLGAGHVNFSEEENVAIITSHFSTYVTIIDLDTFEIKAKIEISKSQFHEDDRHLLQLHNPLVSSDGRYFYTAASHDGDFVKIDLRTLKVDSKLHVGGILDQTSS